MKCPKCNNENMHIHKEVDCVYQIPLTKKGTVRKNSLSKFRREWDTTKEYLCCPDCSTDFHYEVSENGKVLIIDEC